MTDDFLAGIAGKLTDKEREQQVRLAAIATGNDPDIFVAVHHANERCTCTLLNFLQQPTLANQTALEDALRAYRDAWIRSKS